MLSLWLGYLVQDENKIANMMKQSAIPWSNYGYLCLIQSDLELASAAFEVAQAVDPEWISSWIGQAYVANMWGSSSATLFEHAFETCNGSIVSHC